MREVIAYEFDDFRLDVKRRELLKNGEPLALTHKAFQVLLILVQNFEQTVEKENIYRELWADSFVEDANLTQHIYILRKTLGKTPSGESYIETVARSGYRFKADVRPVFSPSVLKAQQYFSRQRGSAEPALKLDSLAEPHLRLAAPVSAVEPSDEMPGSNRRGVLHYFGKYRLHFAVVIGIVAVATIATWIFWPRHHAPVATSIAVLPFKPIGEETENAKMGLGMADAIITRLTMLKQVPVRPTSSVIRYTDRDDVNSIAVGKEIGVDSVLEGTVQREDSRVRVSVKLLDVNSGKTIWGDNFDENYTDIFNVQDSISKRVVRALQVSLTPQEEKQIANRGTTNADAFQAYQMGVYYHGSRSKENLLKAEEQFKQAIALDPNFAKAYAMLADTYNMLRYYRFADFLETRDKALIAATKALELDKSEPEAYVALAQVAGPGEQGRLKAKSLLETALSLSPYHSSARMRYGWTLVMEDLEKASEQIRLAVEYDPTSPVVNGAYCNVLIYQRRFKEAIQHCEKAAEIAPESPSVRIFLADAYFLDGRTDDAIKQVNLRINETSGREQLGAKGSLAYYYLKSGRKAEAEDLIKELEANVKEFPNVNADLAILAYARGRSDEGFRYFLEAHDRRLFQAPMLKLHPIWAEIWNDPRVREKWETAYASPAR